MADPTRNVGLASCEVIVQADHFIAGLHEAINQVGAKEAGTASDEVDLHPQGVSSLSTIADTGASATVDSSACWFNAFRRTSPRSASSSPTTKAQGAPLRSARLNCLPKAEPDASNST